MRAHVNVIELPEAPLLVNSDNLKKVALLPTKIDHLIAFLNSLFDDFPHAASSFFELVQMGESISSEVSGETIEQYAIRSRESARYIGLKKIP